MTHTPYSERAARHAFIRHPRYRASVDGFAYCYKLYGTGRNSWTCNAQKGDAIHKVRVNTSFGDVMHRQADAFRAVMARSTPDDPITLSRELYDKMPPEQRYRFKREGGS